MAMLYKTDGSVQEVKPKEGPYFSLEEMQGYVGGMIDILPLPSGKLIVINDNGKLDGLPTNEAATEVWKEEYPIAEYPHNNDELIVGDVLIAEESEIE